MFCFECIETWSHTTNLCPLCKTRFREISTPGKSKKTRVRQKEQEASYGPEDYAEENYGDAQDYLLEEEDAVYQDALLGVNFVGFGLRNYNEAEDSSFNGSELSSSDVVLVDSEDDEDEDEDVVEADEEEVESLLNSSYTPGKASPDSLASVWRGRDSSFRDPEEEEEPESSSATPIRRSTRGRNTATAAPQYALRNREINRYPLRTREINLVEDDVEPTKPATRARRAPGGGRAAAAAAPPPPPPSRRSQRRQTIDLISASETPKRGESNSSADADLWTPN